MNAFKSYLKFFFKVRIIAIVRSLLVYLFADSPNGSGWEERMLLINLEGIGDVVIMTGILKNYRRDLPNAKLYLLINENVALDEASFSSSVHEVIFLNYRSFTLNPIYGFKVINDLRRIGFHKVVSHDPSAAEIMGKTIASKLGAREILGYEGLGIQFKLPFDINMKKNVEYVREALFPNYTNIIPSIDRNADLKNRLAHFLKHYAEIYRGVTGKYPADIAPELTVSKNSIYKVRDFLEPDQIKAGSYCVLTLGTTTAHREWGVENFAEASEFIYSRGIPIVLVGAQREQKLAQEFSHYFKHDFLNLVGRLTILDLISLINDCLFSLSNDTAPTHISVALRKPSLTILGLGHFGMLSLYGYADINHWVYDKNMNCLCDNWRCIWKVGPEDPVPCLSAVSAEKVIARIEELINYLRSSKFYPAESFRLDQPI